MTELRETRLTSKDLFVGTSRKRLLKRLLSLVQDSCDTGSMHYSLIVGPRGIGKTYLLQAVSEAIENNVKTRNQVRVALLSDTMVVSSYQGLLTSILEQLTQRYGLISHTLSRVLAQRSPGLSHLQDALETVLLDVLGAHVLVLGVENFDDMLRNMADEDQKRFRAFLQVRGVTTIVATSTTLTPALQDRERPFFAFFNRERLDPFTFSDFVDALRALSTFHAEKRLAEILDSSRGIDRIKAVYTTISGNPQLCSLFYRFWSRQAWENLENEVRALKQKLTPYYLSRLATLEPNLRALINPLIEDSTPIAARKLHTVAGVSSKDPIAEIRQLLRLGYLLTRNEADELFYELREPLMRLCLQPSIAEGEPNALLVDFFRLCDDILPLSSDETIYIKALSRSRHENELSIASSHEAILMHRRDGENRLALARLRFLIETTPTDRWAWDQLVMVRAERREFDELLAEAKERSLLLPDELRSWIDLHYLYSSFGRFDEALDASTRALALAPRHPEIWLFQLLNLRDSGKNKDLIETAERALLLKPVANSYQHQLLIAEAMQILGRFEEAAHAWINVLSSNALSYSNWQKLHICLERIGSVQSRLTLAQTATEEFPDNPESFRDLSTAFSAKGDYKSAIASMDRAISLASDAARLKGEKMVYLFLSGDLVGAKAASEYFNDWQSATGGASPFAWLSLTLLASGDRTAAKAALEKYLSTIKAKNETATPMSPIPIVALTEDVDAWEPHISLWLEVHREGGALCTLGQALAVSMLRGPYIRSPEAARRWYGAWEALGGSEKDLEPWLDVLRAEVSAVEGPTDLSHLAPANVATIQSEVERYLWKSQLSDNSLDGKIAALIRNDRRAEMRTAGVGASIAQVLDAKTTLLEAAKSGQAEVCRSTIKGLDGGSQPTTSDLEAALHIASEQGNEEILRILLSSDRVDVNAIDAEGRTPLHLAALNGHAGACRILLGAKRIDVNLMTPTGRTALHFAAQAGAASVCLMLIRAGAKAGATTNAGKTPLDIAKGGRHASTMDILSATQITLGNQG